MAIGVAGALLTLVPWLPAIVAGLALWPPACSSPRPPPAATSAASRRDDRGLAVGLYSTFYYAGGSLGGALPALFWTTGGWTACVALVVVVQLATMMLALSFWTHRGRAVAMPETAL